jgi:ABC-type multidrug transport system fused ATPase/permease subunit
MGDLKELTQIDWWYVFIALCLLLFCVKVIWSLLDWLLFEKLGIETKKMKQRRQERELMEATAKLAKTTAENLSKLQERQKEDKEEFRKNLNDYMEESRKDRKALHDEMTRFTDNRINDRKQSLQIQKELKDSIKDLIDGQQDRDEKINNLTDMFVDKEINDYRWEIINFATKVSEGRPCNKDSFKHCLRTYEKYESLLEKYGLENGEVEISMQVVNEAYKKKLLEGF